MDALEHLCDNMPKSYADQCDALVDTYGDVIIKYAKKIMDPEFVCEKIELCPSKHFSPKKLVGVNKVKYTYLEIC